MTRKTEYEKVSPILYIKVVRLNTRAAFFMRKRKEYKDMKLTKYEKETIILTSEGDDTYSVYTFNAGLNCCGGFQRGQRPIWHTTLRSKV